MKTCKFVVLVVCMSLFTFGCLITGPDQDPDKSPDKAPDLVVTTLETTGSPTVDPGCNCVQVPIRVVVENRGYADADTFKVSTEFLGGVISPSTISVAQFTVPGQSDSWYPSREGSFAAGAKERFDGTVSFHPQERDVTVILWAVVDSCAGDEFMPAYCRVKESNEDNNMSFPILVDLPP